MEVQAAPNPVKVTPRRAHVAHAWMLEFSFTELEAEATRRRMHPDALAARILERALIGGLVGELLDC